MSPVRYRGDPGSAAGSAGLGVPLREVDAALVPSSGPLFPAASACIVGDLRVGDAVADAAELGAPLLGPAPDVISGALDILLFLRSTLSGLEAHRVN